MEEEEGEEPEEVEVAARMLESFSRMLFSRVARLALEKASEKAQGSKRPTEPHPTNICLAMILDSLMSRSAKET